MSNIKLPSVNFLCDTTYEYKGAMTFKFLNFHVLNLAKPGKNTLKNEFTFTYTHEKEESRCTLCYVAVLFTLR